MQLSAAEIHERLEPLFRENFEKFDELGAALSIWQDGKPILDRAVTYQTDPAGITANLGATVQNQAIQVLLKHMGFNLVDYHEDAAVLR